MRAYLILHNFLANIHRSIPYSFTEMVGIYFWLVSYYNDGPAEDQQRKFLILILLLLIRHYSLFKFLACSNTFFHLSLFCVTFFQLHKFMLFISSKTSCSKRFWIFQLVFWTWVSIFNLLHILIFSRTFNMAQPFPFFL